MTEKDLPAKVLQGVAHLLQQQTETLVQLLHAVSERQQELAETLLRDRLELGFRPSAGLVPQSRVSRFGIREGAGVGQLEESGPFAFGNLASAGRESFRPHIGEDHDRDPPSPPTEVSSSPAIVQSAAAQCHLGEEPVTEEGTGSRKLSDPGRPGGTEEASEQARANTDITSSGGIGESSADSLYVRGMRVSRHATCTASKASNSEHQNQAAFVPDKKLEQSEASAGPRASEAEDEATTAAASKKQLFASTKGNSMVWDMPRDRKESIMTRRAVEWSADAERGFNFCHGFCIRAARRIVGLAFFEIVWFTVILANSIVLGAQIQWESSHIGADTPLGFTVISVVFTCLFVAELLLRILCHERIYTFFYTGAWGWGLFDCLMVLCSITDMILSLGGFDSGSTNTVVGNVRFIRLLRIVRILRAVRVLKVVQHVGPLRTLISSIMATMYSLTWAMLLLAIMIYVFGIIFCDVTNGYISDLPPAHDQTATALLESFQGVHRSMWTLVQSITNGTNWGDRVLAALVNVSWFWAYLYLLYICFALFAVLNTMTGVFCQSAIETVERDQEVVVLRMMQDRRLAVQSIERLFLVIGRNKEEGLQLEDFRSFCEDESFSNFLADLDMEARDAMTLFRLLDRDGNGSVEIDEFVDGCLRLRGPAKAVDVATVKFEIRSLRNKLSELSQTIKHVTKSIRGQTGTSLR